MMNTHWVRTPADIYVSNMKIRNLIKLYFALFRSVIISTDYTYYNSHPLAQQSKIMVNKEHASHTE